MLKWLLSFLVVGGLSFSCKDSSSEVLDGEANPDNAPFVAVYRLDNNYEYTILVNSKETGNDAKRVCLEGINLDQSPWKECKTVSPIKAADKDLRYARYKNSSRSSTDPLSMKVVTDSLIYSYSLNYNEDKKNDDTTKP